MTREEPVPTMEDLAVAAARAVLWDFTGTKKDSTDDTPVALIQKAIALLPAGRTKLRLKRERLIAKAVGWLLEEVPAGSPEYSELHDQVSELWRRAE